jgi:hypothetical protein
MRAIVVLLCGIVLGRATAASDWIWELSREMDHFGAYGNPEWDEYRNVPINGATHLIPMQEANPVEWTLFFRQRDVKLDWRVRLNEKVITNLFLAEDDLVGAIPIPAGVLQKGTNRLELTKPAGMDDIEWGDFRLDRRPLRLVFRDGGFGVEVTEKGKPLPCRVTVVDTNGSLFPFLLETTNGVARPGVAYLGNGRGDFKLPLGTYTIFVGRGFEYGLWSKRIVVSGVEKNPIKIELEREVDTRGWVACDTHVHTLTFSGHGDATAEERAITLAGEGIELPIATDHNVIIDPLAPAKATGMDRFFTPVVGDEVTTSHAHFNIFPIDAGARVPNFRINDWPELMKELRGTAGVKVVILNHPRNIHNRFQPFAATSFNAQTGENLRGPEFSFDAVEVLNSSALQSDWMLSFRDWMALLNYGYRVTAVGASDCHDVSRYIVGQGRTYIAVDDSDVARIDVGKACESLLAGRASVSMGLLAEMKVKNKFEVEVTVQGPSWTAVDQVQVFANGELIRDEKFEAITRPGIKKQLKFNLEKRVKDFYLVAIASGPPVAGPYWRIPKPYQPTSTTWKPRVVGATNPIWVDADGDGHFTPLRLQK